MTTRYEYAILLSHATETAIPGLVIPTPDITTSDDVTIEAVRVARAVGVRAIVMRSKGEGGWLTRQGLTPQEALDKGAADGWKGWPSS
jgi:hypothetical protein